MKILHINTNDRGGAAKACIRIHLALLENGIDSKILFLNKTKRDLPQSYEFNKKLTFSQRLFKKLKSFFLTNQGSIKERYPQIEMFTDPRSPYDITTDPLYKEADVIQLNWVSGFLDEPSFFKKNNKPVVWRMADLYTCGGGYHYEKGFPFSELKGILNDNEVARRKALKNQDITFIPISNWVNQKAKNSDVIKEFPRVIIHNGLDFSQFQPSDKNKARHHYNLPLDKKIVLIGADIAHSPRKGFQIAVEAIQYLNDDMIQPVVFGKFKGKLPDNFIELGYINDDKDLSVLYSAGDLFLMTSIEEAFGQITIEALSCGLPVISFPNGGSLDIITPNLNGILVEDFNAISLSKALKMGLDCKFDSSTIIKDVKDRFDIGNKVEDYVDLYKNITIN